MTAQAKTETLPAVNEVIEGLLRKHVPQETLFIGQTLPPVLQAWQDSHAVRRLDLSVRTDDELLQHVGEIDSDCIIVSEVLLELSPHAAMTLLAALRNYLNARICVVLPDTDNPLHFNDFIGLGFRRLANCQSRQGSTTIYSYAIAEYNHVRTWNNSRYWANPELFGKYWW